ncbi:MAG: HD domain-containing protein [Planctomycetia bacterium]|nr:HD domain-containing protein [Planctomycetia bacterium]
MPLTDLPELVSLESHAEGVRIPPGVTVPLTPRVRALLDTSAMRRLARVSQLGLVALVYPGAVHSRLEHSLGVYRRALEFLARLRHDPRFVAVVGEDDAAAFVVAALVHDIGHWPFCHPIEDVGLAAFPRHESLVERILATDEPAAVLRRAWGLDPARVASLITGTATDPAGRILHSLLSGPIDVDKMDYLGRDSLHAGVPYGRHFDEERLLASLCLDEHGTALAITDKGRTAAEMLVFARYVMFSEVYWHHAVRSATAMLQRAVWILRDDLDPNRLVGLDDHGLIDTLRTHAAGTAAAPLVAGLFGDTRVLLKRVASYDAVRHPGVHRGLSGRSYDDKVAIAARVAAALSERAGLAVGGDDLVIDAPPAEREVEFRLTVREPAGDGFRWRRFETLSPVVRSLAYEQFDDLVKRVRIFAPAAVAARVTACPGLEDIILEATGQPP